MDMCLPKFGIYHGPVAANCFKNHTNFWYPDFFKKRFFWCPVWDSSCPTWQCFYRKICPVFKKNYIQACNYSLTVSFDFSMLLRDLFNSLIIHIVILFQWMIACRDIVGVNIFICEVFVKFFNLLWVINKWLLVMQHWF